MNCSLSNYIIDQKPLQYGGQQEDYINKRNHAIEEMTTYVNESVKTKKNLKDIFHQIKDRFALTRHELAVSHQTENAYHFGRKRWDMIEDIEYTTLYGQYQAFNSPLIQKISNLITIPLKGGPLEKEVKKEAFFLGRKCSLEVKLITSDEIIAKEWDKPYPEYAKEIINNSNIVKFETDSIDEKRCFPTQDEQILIDQFKDQAKLIKQNHPNLYLHSKMHYILSGLNQAFPRPKISKKIDGSVLIEGNKYHLKSLFISAKVRIEIKGKMYALSEYITWTYQDFKTDPKERMKNSTVFILHQDQFLIDDTLNEISDLFEKVMQWDSSKQTVKDLKHQVALIRYLFAHCTPYRRGSAAIGEWLEILIYKVKGFECQHNSQTMGDLEAFIAPLFSDFLKVYDTTFTLSQLDEKATS